jgi:hypothetical protein
VARIENHRARSDRPFQLLGIVSPMALPELLVAPIANPSDVRCRHGAVIPGTFLLKYLIAGVAPGVGAWGVGILLIGSPMKPGICTVQQVLADNRRGAFAMVSAG